MLSPSEFIVGKVGSAKPLSLVLPTTKYEQTMLVGQINEVAAAVVLSGKFRSQCFESEGNKRWGGLIVPDVRVVIDETSIVDTYSTNAPSLSVIRIDTRLVIPAREFVRAFIFGYASRQPRISGRV